MANRDQASRRGLMAHRYREDVLTRLNKANIKPVKTNANYRYVKLGDEIFPIHIDMVDVYNRSERSFKRGMKKAYKKMMKKTIKKHNEGS